MLRTLYQKQHDATDALALIAPTTCSSRQYIIAGGTSKIQRNVLGERQLGLPKG